MAKNNNENNNEITSILKSFKDSIDSLNNSIKKIDFKGVTAVIATMQAEMLAGAVAIKGFIDSVSLSGKNSDTSANLTAKTFSNLDAQIEKSKQTISELTDKIKNLEGLQKVAAGLKTQGSMAQVVINPETGKPQLLKNVEGEELQKLAERLDAQAKKKLEKNAPELSSEEANLQDLQRKKMAAEVEEQNNIDKIEAEKKKTWKSEFKNAKLGKKMSMLVGKAVTDGPKIPEMLKNAFASFKGFFKGPATGIKAATGLNIFGKVIDANIGILKFFGRSLMAGVKWFSYLSIATAALVAAFNPALTQNFMLTLKDLAAVFGAALQPALTAFTIILRALADSLMPIVNKLAPSFDLLGTTIISFLTPILQAFVAVLDNLVPSINDAISSLSSALGELGQVIGNLIRALSPLLKFNLFIVSIFAKIVDVISGVFNSIYNFFSGWIGWLFGMKKEEAKFGVTNESQGMSARKAEYQGIADLSANLIKAAFAGPQTDRLKNIDNNGKKQIELLEQIAEKKNPQPVVNVNNNRLAGAKA